MLFKSESQSGHPLIRFQSIFCLTGSVTHNSDVKSRETEVHQSTQVEHSLPLAEQCVRQHREQQSEINSVAVFESKMTDLQIVKLHHQCTELLTPTL